MYLMIGFNEPINNFIESFLLHYLFIKFVMVYNMIVWLDIDLPTLPPKKVIIREMLMIF